MAHGIREQVGESLVEPHRADAHRGLVDRALDADIPLTREPLDLLLRPGDEHREHLVLHGIVQPLRLCFGQSEQGVRQLAEVDDVPSSVLQRERAPAH